MMTFIPQKSLNNGLMLLWVVWYRQVLLHALLTFTVVNNYYRPTHIHTGWSALARSPIIVLIVRGKILVQVKWCTAINGYKIIITIGLHNNSKVLQLSVYASISILPHFFKLQTEITDRLAFCTTCARAFSRFSQRRSPTVGVGAGGDARPSSQRPKLRSMLK